MFGQAARRRDATSRALPTLQAKRCIQRLWWWLILFAAVRGRAFAQPVILPPLYSDSTIIEALVGGQTSASKQVEILHQVAASTNVMPLEWGNRRRLPDSRFVGDKAYYQLIWYTQVAIRGGKYRLIYTRGVVQQYTGSPGAAQLFLDTQGRGVRYWRRYDVDAYMNNSEVTSWTLERSIPLRTKQGEGVLQTGVSLLDAHRIQQGNLRGNMLYWQFEGDLSLDTTLGLPPEQQRAWGGAIHCALVMPLGGGTRMGLWGENLLAQIWQRSVQQIRALVRTNTVIPDADGFLHEAPFLSGKVQETRKTFRIQPRYTIGTFIPVKQQALILLVQHSGEWTYQIGYAKGSNRVLYVLPKGIWACEWRTRTWRWQIGVSDLQLNRTKHAFLTVQWVSPLGE